MEHWKTISRYPAYEVSDQGRVRRSVGGRGAVAGRILKSPVDSEGYPHVNLADRTERIHVLVAEAFLGPIEARGQVHHRNQIRTDCRAENLEVTGGRHEHAERHRRVRFDLRRAGEPNPAVACGCGCGETFARYDSLGRPRRFRQGHNARVEIVEQVAA